jgi:alcohol dehydrogenase
MNLEFWSHHNPVTIQFGRGCRVDVAEHFSDRCLIVTSKRGRQQLESDPLLGDAVFRSKPIWIDNVRPNPDIVWLQKCIDNLAHTSLNTVVAFGGGSSIDCAKTIAFALSPFVRARKVEELIGEALISPAGSRLPLYALPTTAGTGSEVTPFATIWDYDKRRKLSLAGPAIYPSMTYIDSELAYNLPESVTLSTGLDAINQAAESIWSKRMTPVSESLAHRALILGFTSLPRLLVEPADQDARDAMAQTSLLAGLAISQTRTALCHAISYPLTVYYGVPHGLACAFTMSAVLRYSLREDDGRFRRLAALMVSDCNDTPGLVRQFDRLINILAVPERVRVYVKHLDALLVLVDDMLISGRAGNSLIPVDKKIVQNILVQSWNGFAA